MGYRLREVRVEKGISQMELAKRSGVTRTTIWKLESGDNTAWASTKTLQKLADALGVSVTALFFDQPV